MKVEIVFLLILTAKAGKSEEAEDLSANVTTSCDLSYKIVDEEKDKEPEQKEDP